MRGGFKMLPETIETALNRHPAVAVSAVTGVADPRLGQVPAAAVQVRAGMDTPDIAALEAHLRAHLPATHIPARWRIVTTLPRTPSMKVDRMALGGLFDSDDD
jgi:acyl-coenzyme A synthetase/AMP-(fatty) acid ligase